MTTSLATLLGAFLVGMPAPLDDAKPEGPFAQRGYYITFMRMPTYDLADWKAIVDGIRDDGGNTLLLWIAGAATRQARATARIVSFMTLSPAFRDQAGRGVSPGTIS